MVDAHCFEGFVVTFWREGCFEDGQDCVAELGFHFVEAEAFGAEKEFGIGPGAPFGGVDVVTEGFLLSLVAEV